MFSKIKAVGRRAATVAAGTVLVLSQCLGSFGAAFAPSMAYADTSTKTATVTLADTENGSLSFVGRDDDTKTITVNVGETVAIKASPADGYFADSLSVFNNSDNDASAVSLKDGIGTFKVTGSATVSTMFYENGSNGSSILKAVKVKEGKANKAIVEKTYIKENADSKYVGLGDKLEKKDVLTVTTTVVDSNILPNASLDNLWADDDGDGMSDHADALRANAVSHAILYDLKPAFDYHAHRRAIQIRLRSRHYSGSRTVPSNGSHDSEKTIQYRYGHLLCNPCHFQSVLSNGKLGNQGYALRCSAILPAVR